jgi:spore coat polysaccharide biosynthesis protein SpsF
LKQTHQKTVTIIQARMGSSRLPGKVLKGLGGQPMLAHVIRRTQRADLVDEVWVATTTNTLDEAVVAFCEQMQVPVYQGSEFDVLDRYYHTALAAQADLIVRVTADCPLMDPDLIDQVITAYRQNRVDFAANRLPPPWQRTYPIGLDIEVTSFQHLEHAWEKANQSFEREHVMPYFYDQPGRFKTLLLHHEIDLGAQRWTVDTPQDLAMMEKVFDHFKDGEFTWLDVHHWLTEHPEVQQINADVRPKSMQETDDRLIPEKR